MGSVGRWTMSALPMARRTWTTLAVQRQMLSSLGSSRGDGPGWHGTTILSVRKGDKVAVIGDGQCTMGSVVIKPTAKKVRRIGPGGSIVAGFAGATADAFTLLERLETKIEEHPGQLMRACVNLAKDWRMDKYLRRLDSTLIVCDANLSLTVTGVGDVLEPNDGVVAIGSGGSYATAAALALHGVDGYDAETIARKAMQIAADMCIYTNHNFTMELIDSTEGKLDADKKTEKDRVPLYTTSSSAATADADAATSTSTASDGAAEKEKPEESTPKTDEEEEDATKSA